MPGYAKPVYFIFLVIATFGVAGGVLAYKRGRSIVLWCLLSMIFPIFLLVIWFQKPIKEVPGGFRQCAGCKEWIGWDAAVCKYCNASQPPA
ncbi:MAG: hypothetical protein HYS23_02045 [Geobacter sp.]|nr:hypothetical protein [Geobacter sp.]